MKFGKVAILITLAAAALRCSGNPPVSEPGQAPLTAPSAVVIHGIDHTATPSGTEVVLHGNYPFSYTSYQPDPKTLVLELLDVHLQGLSEDVAIGTPQVEGVHVSSVESVDGGTIAKFEFRNVLASQHAIRLDGNDLVIDFPTLGEAGSAPEPPLVAQEVVAGEEPPATAEGSTAGAAPGSAENAPLEPLPSSGTAPVPPQQTTAPDLQAVPSAAPATGSTSRPTSATPHSTARPATEAVKVMRGPVPAGTPARTLLAVEARTSDQEPVVVLKADGALAQEHFELKNPPRLVIDLLGVVDRTSPKSIAVASGVLSRVRVAQFATKPRPVARVVLDMSAPKPYALVPTDDGLVVDFTEAAAPAAETPVAEGSVEAAPTHAAPSSPLLASGEAKVEARPRDVAFRPAGSDGGREILISQGGS